jgi:hypothetical protein
LLLAPVNAAASDSSVAINNIIMLLMYVYTLLLAELVPGRGLALFPSRTHADQHEDASTRQYWGFTAAYCSS